ncbi:MAG: DUF4342 domain-containing protein [Clostridia bacterium]|nr:DUF4342 domain-containing protein [Clostridia bacterium]
MSQNLELVEKLVEKTGLSYGEAKQALEKNDWDILEALIQLEAQGRVNGGKTAQYTTSGASNDYQQNQQSQQNQQNNQGEKKSTAGENFKKTTKSIGEWLKSVFDKGNKNSLIMQKNNEKKLEIPVTAFVVLLIFCFWVIIPLMIVALFFGCRFSFSGNELGKESVNSAMGKATDIADNIKSEFKAN